MSLNLPRPGPAYEPINEAQTRNTLVQADAQNVKKTDDVTIDPSRNRLVIISPDGTRWAVAVDNAGALSASAL